jgi:hypothetical protein
MEPDRDRAVPQVGQYGQTYHHRGEGLDGSTNGFKANGSAKATRIDAKKLEQEATSIVDDAVKDLMTKQLPPQMFNPRQAAVIL